MQHERVLYQSTRYHPHLPGERFLSLTKESLRKQAERIEEKSNRANESIILQLKSFIFFIEFP